MQQYKRLLAVILFLALLLAAFELTGLHDHFNLAFLQQRIAENLITGLSIFVLLFALGNLIQIRDWLFLAAAVLTLGRSWGGLATYVAACISCVLTFFTIRLIGGEALRQLQNKTAVRIHSQLDAQPIRSVVFLRVLFQTVPAINYALALSGIRFRQYLTGTLLGLPLPFLLYCLFFDYMVRALKLPGFLIFDETYYRDLLLFATKETLKKTACGTARRPRLPLGLLSKSGYYAPVTCRSVAVGGQ